MRVAFLFYICIIDMKSKEEIQEKYPSICYSCNRARKVPDTNEQKGHVGCVIRLLKGSNKDHLEIEEGEEVAEGWIYSKRRPFSESSGTLGDGVMTNMQLITKRISSCKQFVKTTDL